MDLNKFTEKSQEAIMEAQNIAVRNEHQAVDAEHLLLALLEQENGLIPDLFEKAGLSVQVAKARLQDELNKLPRVSGTSTSAEGVYITQRLKQILVRAIDESKKLKDEYVSVEHIILSMLAEPATTGVGRVF
jgi:ATP-dependent Clp protease ATP-binding subunit ClpB